MRRAFALESVFWEALEDMAGVQKQRLGRLIESILTEDVPSNASSGLRTAAANWLLTQYRALSTRDISRIAQSVVDSILAPALVLSHGKQVIAFNKSFRNLGQSASAHSRPALVQLRLAAPLERIVELLTEQPSRILVVNGVIELGEARSKGTVSIALLERIGAVTYVLCTVRGLSPAG